MRPLEAGIFSRFCSVGGHAFLEAVAPSKAVLPSDVPRSHFEITPAWLTAVLCKGIPGACVLDFQAIAGSRMPLLPDMQPERVSLDIIERTGNAILDLEALKAING